MPTLDSAHEERLRRLMVAFLAKNAVINLSALRTEEACWTGNILDSLPLLDLLPSLGQPTSLVDVGTGGGFPLLPLAIFLPQTSCIGLDSTRKKTEAVDAIAKDAGITNARCMWARAEDAGHDAAHRERYDLVLARAVAATPTLLELCAPLAKVGGHVVLWKSMHAEDELAAGKRAAGMLHCEEIRRFSYDLGGDWGTRQLVVYRKNARVGREYPRLSGLPGKHPLGAE